MSTSARHLAWVRPTPRWMRPTGVTTGAPTWSSASWRPTAGRRRPRCWKAWRSSRERRSPIGARCSPRWTSARCSPASQRSPSSTSSPTRTSPAAATPSAGRTSASSLTPVSMSSPMSTSSTWSHSTTWSRGSRGCRSGRPCPMTSSVRPTRSRWSTWLRRRFAGGWRTATSTLRRRSTRRCRTISGSAT